MFKKITLSALGIFLFSNANAAKFESIYLSDDMQACVNSMQLKFSPLTSRILEDELLGGGMYWKNPFRNIDRAMRKQGSVGGACVRDYLTFRENALMDLNTKGYIKIYGSRTGTEAKDRLGHFLDNSWFKYGGL